MFATKYDIVKKKYTNSIKTKHFVLFLISEDKLLQNLIPQRTALGVHISRTSQECEKL